MDGLQSFLTLFEKYSVPLIVCAVVIFFGIQAARVFIRQMEKRSEIKIAQEKEKGELELKNQRMRIERQEQERKLLYEVQTEQVTQMKSMSETLEKIQTQMYDYMSNIDGNVNKLSNNINLMWTKYDTIDNKLDDVLTNLAILIKINEELNKNAGKTRTA